ncbi:hypothetical protein SCH01S_49_00250 [Sphingomonas changbaiensis NBRC 104936]|uniref:Uncharacterized protein n=1 Tax=Sphingomonas changbaiensis NBRC 104936 TaxID=1219043 RepID=A0A0E9MT61_9SPHN|nr:hypothetical protein [Sphingomonas changbaiensis]GAO40611.1 hypothetical protein SCH01S_49_00250 [Sphingomonas changbaiensis NBRC 104936]
MSDTESDSATQAFHAMEGRLALLQRAIEGLAAERNALPDYRPSIEALAEQQAGLAQALKAIQSCPAVQVTHETFAETVQRTTQRSRENSRATIDSAAQKLIHMTRQLEQSLATARTSAEQCEALIWTCVLAMGGTGALIALAQFLSR